MKRRPHWDTELEQSVSAILFDCYNNGVSEEQVYQVIAAVEDWMDANDNPLPHVLNECLQWLDAERAAIQRVREVMRHLDEVAPDPVDPRQVQRALRIALGDSEPLSSLLTRRTWYAMVEWSKGRT